jgi:sugar/nucleoside kinase (ribokinase family)
LGYDGLVSDEERPRIVSIGEVGLQMFGVVPRFPDSDRPVELEEISIQIGGAAAIAAGTAVALGCRAEVVCKLADDITEQFLIRALRQAGVECRGVLDKDRVLSPLSFCAIAREGNRRLHFFTGGDVGELLPDDIDPGRVLDGASAVLVDGHDPAAQEAVAERARELRVPVIFDASEVRPGIGTLAALADVIICSERLAAELAPRDSLEDSLIEIQGLGPRAVIITLGDAGSVGLLGDEMVQQSSFPIDIADTTGAGSVYHGAFAAAMVAGLPFAQCMELASAAAALSCQELGGWAGIPRRADVVELVRIGPSEGPL